MSESDTLDLKIGRNSVSRSRHLQCVDLINKEQSSMMRMFHSNEARFRHQYMRYEPKPPSADTDAGKVRMFETHTPGFCYHRNGDIREAAVSRDADTDVFLQDINELLFYNDEVDIERVVVLHLLSMQYVKLEIRITNISRTPSTRSSSLGGSGSSSKSLATGPYGIRRSILMPVLNSMIQSAKERLHTVKTKSKIELKDKNLFLNGTSGKLLPSYLVLPKSKGNDHDEIDGELNENDLDDSQMSLKMPLPSPDNLKSVEKNLRLYVHKPIHIMIDTVLDELQSLKSDKVNRIITLANSPAALREMLMKPEVQEFVESLQRKPLLLRGDLYQLVPVKLIMNSDKDATPQSSLSEDAKIVNTIEISDSSHSAMKSLIAEIKINIVNEERMKEYKQSNEKNLLLSYSLSDISIQPSFPTSTGMVTLKSASSNLESGTSAEPFNTSVGIAAPLDPFRRISKDATPTNEVVKDEGFTITSYTGFSSKLSQADPSILPNISNEDRQKVEEDAPSIPKRKPILSTKVTNEIKSIPVRRESKREARSSKLISAIQMSVMNEMARERKMSPERPDKKPRGDRLSSVDSYHKFETLRTPLAFAAQTETLKQKFLDEMSPFHRMHVFKKLNVIREKGSYVRDEDIPFASYIVPILNKKTIMDIANQFSEKEKKLIFLPEREGGLELPQCYTRGMNYKCPREDLANELQKNNTVSLAEDDFVDTRLTEVDVPKLKCEIAEKETHKKFLRMMSLPVPP